MMVESSRHICEGDIVMVGTGLPMAASLLALKTHAPNMCCVVETGPIAPEVIPTPVSVSDPRVMYHAVSHGSMLDSLGSVLQRGLADIAFLGAAQIDQFANLNSTVIGSYHSPTVRLPGSGGANDMASHARKILVISRHEKRRFPAHCDYITSPGYIDGPHGRKKAGLPVPYPDITVVTNMAVLTIEKNSGRLSVDKMMPELTLEEIRASTGFELPDSENISTVEKPSERELRILRTQVDPKGLYLGSKDTRPG